ncbi:MULTISPECIES: DUF4186 domain-containing protein [Pantoea]|uniref:DUF4186 domain-containing protein n=1 Tax=Pantoea TaxID=53335 RepID=UPI001C05F7D4|nr:MULTISPECIES: DUF4186 domain-containing protein [Pantoea]
MTPLDDLFQRLSRSPFRQRFALGKIEYDYCLNKGEVQVREHAADFIKQRLAAAEPTNDGKQTPMRGHPVFIAQHATGTCCRGCLRKWHAIPQHQALTTEQQAYAVEVILHWIHQQMQKPAPVAKTRKVKKQDTNPQLDLL